jgi:hypothetical protein
MSKKREDSESLLVTTELGGVPFDLFKELSSKASLAYLCPAPGEGEACGLPGAESGAVGDPIKGVEEEGTAELEGPAKVVESEPSLCRFGATVPER